MGLLPVFKIYTPDEVTVTFGPVILHGFADGEFIRFEPDADNTSDSAGVDGEVAITRINDLRGRLTVILQQTSDANDELSVFDNLARTAPKMTGAIWPCGVIDRNGRTVIEATNAWVLRTPNRSFDKTPKNIEWVFRLSHVVKIDGGN